MTITIIIIVKQENDTTGIEKQEKRRKSKAESEASTIPPEHRRESIEAENEEEGSGDEHEGHKEEDKHKGHRRFSLDFFFGKKAKKQKGKRKRAQSIANPEGAQDQQQPPYYHERYPGIAENDFSMFYFI